MREGRAILLSLRDKMQLGARVRWLGVYLQYLTTTRVVRLVVRIGSGVLPVGRRLG
jgi:hypothetical protein